MSRFSQIAATLFVLISMSTASAAEPKYTPQAVWLGVDRLEHKTEYAVIRVPDYINIGTAEVKKRYGDPSEVTHYHLEHPPRTVTIWRYKRANGFLEFRFFLDTKHVNQIELKKAK